MENADIIVHQARQLMERDIVINTLKAMLQQERAEHQQVAEQYKALLAEQPPPPPVDPT